jgi:1-acyl-sn-glycerol-3-phosphate acyltransferase
VSQTPDHHRALPRLLRLPFAIYAVTLFAVLAIAALIVVLPVPWQSLRRKIVRRAARIALAAMGMRVSAQHLEHLPTTPSIVVANHSSYIDGVVLFAALPPVFGFVIKREMSRVPLANSLLRRIGAHYVDRGQGHKGARDTRKLLKKAASGGALAFFPEGTFNRQPGLMKFRQGAFLVAARAQFPVVPIAIRGTRRALPPGTFMPHPTRIEVELAPPLAPPLSNSENDVQATLKASRQAILERIGEPDRSPEG